MGEITESDLHEIADELLAQGEADQAVIHLFSIDRDELRWSGAKAFESLLRAFGGGTMTEDEAAQIIVRDLAAGVLAGTMTPLAATTRAEAINVHTVYEHYDVFGEWCALHEELEYLDSSGLSYLGRDKASVEADVRALARSVADNAARPPT